VKKIEAGNVYLAKRTDIPASYPKFQLFFDELHILLINTDGNRNNINVTVTPEDCPILTNKESCICIDNLFRFEPEQKVIRVAQMSTACLEKLKTMLPMSNTITTIDIKKMVKIIENVVDSRK